MNSPTEAQLKILRSIEINAAVKRGVAAVQHHKKLTSRVCDAIEAELPKDGTSWSCYLDTESTSSIKIRIMGHNPAKHHQMSDDVNYHCPRNSVSFYGSTPPNRELSWQESVAYELNRNDQTDSLQWAAMLHERSEEFRKMNDEVAVLLRQIDRIRAGAQGIIDAMPAPAGATIRKEKHFWNRPDADTAANFKHLFPSK